MLISNIEKFLSKYIEDSDKVSNSQHSYRSFSISKSLKKALLLRHKIGITRINYITKLDYFNIPVFSTSRPNVDRSQFNTSTQGKGTTIRQALLSSLMESYEHHAANSYCGIISYSEDFLKKRNIPFLSLKKFGGKYCENDILDWIKGFKIGNEESLLLPASLVLFPYIPMNGSKSPRVFPYPSTNGLASGNTFIESLLFASLELIERDALSSFIAGGNFQYIDTNYLKDNTSLKKLLQKVIDSQNHICIVMLDNDYNLPVAFVSLVSENPSSPSIPITGHAARTTITSAIEAAVLEAIQIHSTIIQSSREDLFLLDKIWFRSRTDLLNRWFEIKEHIVNISKNMKFSELQMNSSVFNKACFIFEKIATQRNNIYYTDITNSTINIPVSRVLVPGIRDDFHNKDFVPPSLPHLSNFFYGV